MNEQGAGLLVMGGGIAGMTTAVEAAETGLSALIVERDWSLGGRVARMKHYFPKMCPPWCGLEINFRRIRSNPLVRCLTGAEVVEVRGGPGAYEADVRLRPRFVNEFCTACGECAKAAATQAPCEFDYGLSKRKSIYLPHPMAFPRRYVLDRESCGAGELEAIKNACPYGAVDLEDSQRTITVKAGAIAAATGWRPYPAEELDLLGGGKLADVVRNVELERLASPSGPTGGVILRPSDGRAPKRVAFVQCAGSRDKNHLDYCSAVCCSASLKQAGYVLEQDPEAEVEIFYIDIRTPGRLEKFASRIMEDERVKLTKGKVAGIEADPRTGELRLTAEDALSGRKITRSADLAVLAVGMRPAGFEGLRMAGLATDERGFAAGGPIAVGCAGAPLDVAGSVEDATAAALEALAMAGGPPAGAAEGLKPPAQAACAEGGASHG